MLIFGIQGTNFAQRNPMARYPAFINLLNLGIMRICNYAVFAGGMLLGGVIALMFAPKKGTELRADIKQKLGDVKKHVDETIAMCGDACNCGESVNVTVEE